MFDSSKTTFDQMPDTGRMMVVQGIPGRPLPDTTSGVPTVRTVTTSMTTGNLSVRYVPRPAQPGGATDTTF
jgi:hypothetical protein